VGPAHAGIVAQDCAIVVTCTSDAPDLVSSIAEAGLRIRIGFACRLAQRSPRRLACPMVQQERIRRSHPVSGRKSLAWVPSCVPEERRGRAVGGSQAACGIESSIRIFSCTVAVKPCPAMVQLQQLVPVSGVMRTMPRHRGTQIRGPTTQE